MPIKTGPTTLPAGSFKPPPTTHESGWQVTYELGIQDDDLVVTSARIENPVAVAQRIAKLPVNVIPPGGLTSEAARELLRPGAAIRDFLQAVVAGKTTSASPTPEFREYIDWLKKLPAMQRLIRGGPLALLPRRHRLALTAWLYLRACADDEAAPREHVAKTQGRHPNAVRDDISDARHESPVILAGGGQGRRGGRLTDEGKRLVREINAGMRQTPKGGTT